MVAYRWQAVAGGSYPEAVPLLKPWLYLLWVSRAGLVAMWVLGSDVVACISTLYAKYRKMSYPLLGTHERFLDSLLL